MYVIDGIFLTRKLTGIQRFAMNMVKELDKLALPGQFELLVPESCPGSMDLKNIRMVKYGKRKGYIWEQTDLSHYIKKNKAKGLFLENAVPLTCRRGVVALHDISLAVNPGLFAKGLRGAVTVAVWKLIYRAIVRSDMHIVTVSQFSKSEIKRVYGVSDRRISVIYNSWQHMDNIEADESVFGRICASKGNYYFSLATKAPNKNLDWVLAAAESNPDDTFVIAGKGTEYIAGSSKCPNVMTAGYITDSESKALMRGCRAFLFPTFYEGFGLPPIEALASGAPGIVVSDTPCMHEIYGNIAAYIDPHKYDNIRIPEMFPERKDIEEFLGRFSLERSAEKLMKLL